MTPPGVTSLPAVTGARLTGTLTRQLAATGGGTGLATACAGAPQGLAVVLGSCVDREVR